MRNTMGNSISLTVFGESHGEAVGVVIDGLCAGIRIDDEKIKSALARRRPNAKTDTARVEPDQYKIISGVFNGRTTGAPITIIVPNINVKSADYEKDAMLARPSHADYTAHVKYNGFEDYRGGGHFSGRVTAGIVCAGAIFESALENLGIYVGSHILSCKDSFDREFCDFYSDIKQLKGAEFPALDEKAKESIISEIIKAKENADSVGGVIETAIIGLEAGLGEPWFDSFEGQLSKALFSIGGIKGVEFGLGFGFAKANGSTANDQFAVLDGAVKTLSNNNGGINGGITNGMEVLFRCAVKPTPSIYKEQKTINMSSLENANLSIKGRHDPAIIRRICPVIDAISAFVVCDFLAIKHGTDVFRRG